MRLYRWTVLCACAALAAGSVYAAEEVISLRRTVSVRVGQDLPIQIRTDFDEVEKCYLIAPDSTQIDLMNEEQLSDKFELREGVLLYGCQVTIKNIEENDKGTWEISYISDSGTGDNMFYDVNVLPRENDSDIENGNDGEDTTVLPTINYAARIGVNISITLSRKSYNEECYLRSPQGTVIKSEDEIDGIQSYPISSEFVSCRMVIGPMNADLLGTWTLCGRHTEGQKVFERCQPGIISWVNINDPNANWAATRHPEFDHVVHFGGKLSPVVRGSGVVNTCHVITPNGEDIVVTADSDYPGLQRVSLGDTNVCSIAIGAITAQFLGDWVLYGTYNSAFEFNVITLPMHLYLYDLENPYNQAYNVTELPINDEVVNVGSTIVVEVEGSNNRDSCEFVNNNGLRFNQSSIVTENLQRITFVNINNRVSCRLQIGPITEDMFGQWRLIGKFSRNNNIFDERQLPFNIMREDPANPIQDDTRTIEYETEQNILTRFGETITVSTPAGKHVSTDSCHIRTPQELQYTLTDGLNIQGVEIDRGSGMACGVRVDIESEEMLGDWVLIARLNIRGHRIERRLPFSISIEDPANPVEDDTRTLEILPQQNIFTTIGRTHTVSTAAGKHVATDSCHIRTPKNLQYILTDRLELPGVEIVRGNGMSCGVRVIVNSEDMFGDWMLIARLNIRGNRIERRQPFTINIEDPQNPTTPAPEDPRTIEYMTRQDIYTRLGESHILTTPAGKYVATDSCHLKIPNNLEYTLTDGLNLPGVDIVRESGITCGVRVSVNSEDMIGDWMLIARINIRGHRIERRLPFSVNIEEEVAAVPRYARIAEGNDLYLRLENPTLLHDTCTITGPVRNQAEIDENFSESCGFIIKSVTQADSGVWEIVYGHQIKYKARVEVNVTERFIAPDENRLWTKDAPVNETIGPEDTIYCKVESPNSVVMFEGFGRCNVVIDRVTDEHDGIWQLTIGTAGRVLTETHEFVVTVNLATPKLKVITSVATNKPVVVLTCALAGEHEITGCKFRNPTGRVLLATEGVGEDRYTFHGSSVSYQSNATTQNCGLRITGPVTADLGLWRCAVETTEDVYYGFLSVLCPWAMSSPEIAATVVSEPTLVAEKEIVSAVEGDVVMMSCSVPSAIRYCYFRSQNGSIFNVNPYTSQGFEYNGAGLDAGECSIRFLGMQASDSGRWSCHVGFNDPHEPEQRTQISLTVKDLMVAQQHHLPHAENTLVVEAQVHSSRSLDYCRFVRIDGQGFTSANVPPGYLDRSTLESGHCELRVNHPSILDLHPWTVVVRIQGQVVEVARSTDHTLEMPPNDPVRPPPLAARSFSFALLWSCVLIISLALFFVGAMLGPKKNREWTYRRADIIRTSIRRSFVKKPIPFDTNVLPYNQRTPTAA